MTKVIRSESFSSFTLDKINTKKIFVEKFFVDNFESFEDFVIKDE